MRAIRLAVACVAMLTLAVAPAEANLIVNGSFEVPMVPAGGFINYVGGSTGITGWTVVGVDSSVISGTFTQAGIVFQAQNGLQWADLAGVTSNSSSSGVRQNVATTIGGVYELSFYVGSAPGGVRGPFATGARPTGVAVDAQHVAWVVCTNDNTIRRINPDGSAAGPNLAVPPGGPQAIAIDATSQAVWVATVGSGNRVVRFSAAGVASGPFAVASFPAALAIDSRGHVWVAGETKLSELAP